MIAVAANTADDPDRSRDLSRLRELTEPHLPHPGAMIQQVLSHMNADDFAETIAILGRIGEPDENAPAWP
jgi:hypothetical protein